LSSIVALPLLENLNVAGCGVAQSNVRVAKKVYPLVFSAFDRRAGSIEGLNPDAYARAEPKVSGYGGGVVYQ
jgi:hypothetical protein